MQDSRQIILDFLNTYLPLIGLIAFIFLIIFYIRFLTSLKSKNKPFCISFLKDKALMFAFLATLFASFMSLVYSEYLGEIPCGLCWIQRIFIFSQVIIFAVAFIKNDLKVFIYSLWLSIFGAILAFYHEWIQLGYSELIPCPTSTGVVDCAKPMFLEYGFVTFPFLSLVLFLFLILLALIVKNSEK